MQCKFCARGLSCQLCGKGPCIISQEIQRGNCGATAYEMVARNLLYRHVTIGTSANIFHCHQVARTLKAAGEFPGGEIKIRDSEMLRKYADIAGLDTNMGIEKLAVEFSSWVINDIHMPYYVPSMVVEAFAPTRRKELWKKLGLLPGGGYSEVAYAEAKCVTNFITEPVEFLLNSIRLGIANEYQGVYLHEIIHEILNGRAGFNSELVRTTLGGSIKPLLGHIVNGNIRGIVMLIGGVTEKYSRGESNLPRIVQGLIKNNILVVSGGCAKLSFDYTSIYSNAEEESGKGLKIACKELGISPLLAYESCVDLGKLTNVVIKLVEELKVDTNLFPIVIDAQEYLEQKAVSDACSALALGWLVHLASVPSIAGSEEVVKTLTETTENLGLGKVTLEMDPEKTVQLYIEHIEAKRGEMGLG